MHIPLCYSLSSIRQNLRSGWVNDNDPYKSGVLKYFEETDGAHFNGNCFVFDEREALSADLAALDPAIHLAPEV